ncbi:hypothetical protein HBI42_212650 [Parastagonospora nodorum]|nr:hypothetical protein HBI42_212650 [Parastagonospora nodorum]
MSSSRWLLRQESEIESTSSNMLESSARILRNSTRRLRRPTTSSRGLVPRLVSKHQFATNCMNARPAMSHAEIWQPWCAIMQLLDIGEWLRRVLMHGNVVAPISNSSPTTTSTSPPSLIWRSIREAAHSGSSPFITPSCTLDTFTAFWLLIIHCMILHPGHLHSILAPHHSLHDYAPCICSHH